MDHSEYTFVPAMDAEPATGAPERVYDGRIDDRGPAVLGGWSVSSDAEGAPVTVTVSGRAPIEVAASGQRPDLAGVGKSRGDGGWRIDVSELLRPGANSIELRFPDGSPLPGSPVILEGPAIEPAVSGSAYAPEPAQDPTPGADYVSYVGAIDLAEPPILSGWSISSKCDAAPITLEMDDRAPIAVAADGPRPDLVEAGFVKAGGGWSIAIGDLLLPGTNHIRLRFPNGTELPGSPLSIRHGDGPERPLVVNSPQPIPAGAEPLPVPEAVALPAVVAPAPEAVVPRRISASSEPISLSVRKPEPEPESGHRPLTLAELDEISLDDLILAVESGIIDVPPPPPPPPLDEEQRAPPSATESSGPRARRGILGRLFGRR